MKNISSRNGRRKELLLINRLLINQSKNCFEIGDRWSIDNEWSSTPRENVDAERTLMRMTKRRAFNVSCPSYSIFHALYANTLAWSTMPWQIAFLFALLDEFAIFREEFRPRHRIESFQTNSIHSIHISFPFLFFSFFSFFFFNLSI